MHAGHEGTHLTGKDVLKWCGSQAFLHFYEAIQSSNIPHTFIVNLDF